MTQMLRDERLSDVQMEIIAAAAKRFMHKGFDKTTIADIGDELGSTKGLVYHYFRSKSALFFAVYRQAMKYCFDAAEPVVALPLPACERLVLLCEAHAMVMINTLSFQRGIKQGLEIYMRGATTEADRRVFEEMLGLRDAYEALFRKVLRDGNADGTLDVPDVPLASRTILSALNGLPDWYRDRPGGDAPAEIARKMSRHIVSGFEPRRAAPKIGGDRKRDSARVE